MSQGGDLSPPQVNSQGDPPQGIKEWNIMEASSPPVTTRNSSGTKDSISPIWVLPGLLPTFTTKSDPPAVISQEDNSKRVPMNFQPLLQYSQWYRKSLWIKVNTRSVGVLRIDVCHFASNPFKLQVMKLLILIILGK